MKRAVVEGAYNFVIKDVPKPEVDPGQTLVKVRYCSICGSDVHLYKYDKVVGVDPLADSFRKAFGIPVHSVIGHQISGDVVETGAGVTYCKVGDRVALQGPREGYAGRAGRALCPNKLRIQRRQSLASQRRAAASLRSELTSSRWMRS